MAAVSESTVDRALLFRWQKTPEQLASAQESQAFVEELAGGGGDRSVAISAILACCFRGGFDSGEWARSGGADKLQPGLAGGLATTRTSCS